MCFNGVLKLDSLQPLSEGKKNSCIPRAVYSGIVGIIPQRMFVLSCTVFWNPFNSELFLFWNTARIPEGPPQQLPSLVRLLLLLLPEMVFCFLRSGKR
jgi:hypothetical protein